MSGEADYNAIPTHVTEVVRTAPVNGSFVRVTFAGGLDRFRPLGPDDFVYVLLPPPGRAELPIDESFRWSEYYAMAEQDRPVGAYYTVRRFDPEAGELDCDVLRHEPAGHVSRWAPTVNPGAPAALWGPRTGWHPPPDTTDYLLIADETGIPAVCAIIEQRAPGTAARVMLEVANSDHHVPLPSGTGIDVTWVHRDGREAGTTTDLLVDAVRATSRPRATTYAWGGAESRAVTAVRRYLRNDVGLPRERVSMTGYWRHASHAGDLPDDHDD
jgi:NADPH-dependent ferric siderophore reductase